jgi:M6 family metalloprotease-like protein
VFSGSPNCSPAADEVALFLHDQYRGYCTILKKGFYYDPPTMNFPDNQLTSVRVGSNAAIVLYEHKDLRGKREILRVSDSNLSDNLIKNDKVSSVAVFASERDCKPKANQVAVYSHADFGGLCTTLDYGIHSHTAHTNLPDGTISSIRVGAKAEALLCRDMNFKGKCATFTKDDDNLADNGLNDSVSSLLIWKRNKSNLARVWWNYNLGPNRQDHIQPQIKNRHKIVIVLRDPVRPGHPRPSANDIYRIFSGLQDSVNAYFRENSSSLYQIEIVGFYGWFTPEPRKRGNFYWSYSDPNDSDGDGWISGHTQRWADAVRALDQKFYFDKKYDKNGDGTLSPNELGVVIITPQSDSIGGNRRPVYADQVTLKPHRKMLKVDNGLIVPEILEIFLSPRQHLGLTAHEMCHLTLGLKDMYWGSSNDDWYNPYAARAYSVMADFNNHSHLDAVLKLKLGWVVPQGILDSRDYIMTAVESTNRVWIIFGQTGSFLSEYFVLENRWPGTSYERNLPDSGIAIWNVFDITSKNSKMPKPLCTPTTRWNDWNALPLGNKNWERRAIRLIRSGGLRISSCEADRPLADDTAALWGPWGFTKNLRWANRTDSGVSVRPLTSPSPAMTVRVTLPYNW